MSNPFGGVSEPSQTPGFKKDDLQTLCNAAFPANHLLQVSLVRKIPNPTEKPDIKEKVFLFVTLAPGAKLDGSNVNRTYSFENRITQKFSLREIEGLSFILQQLASGNLNVLPYAKFTKFGNSSKVLNVYHNTKPQQIGNDTINVRLINVSISEGSNAKHSITMTPDQAYGFGSVLHQLFLKGMEKELEFPVNTNFNNISSSASSVPSNTSIPVPSNTSIPPQVSIPLTNTVPTYIPPTPIYEPLKSTTPYSAPSTSNLDDNPFGSPSVSTPSPVPVSPNNPFGPSPVSNPAVDDNPFGTIESPFGTTSTFETFTPNFESDDDQTKNQFQNMLGQMGGGQ